MQLTTVQAAERLDVKPETVYAYVSRGLLHPSRAKDGKGSLFDADEVERLAAGRSQQRRRRERGPGIRSALTLIRDGRLYYRGVDVVKLVETATFEGVAQWLWSSTLDSEAEFHAPAAMVKLARKATAPLPSSTRLADRLRVIAAVASSADPFRFHTEPDAVIATAKTLLAVMVDALAPDSSGGKGLAARLWPHLTSQRPAPEAIRALDTAMILMADHGLATSTFAARVAASSRAHPYAVVAAGLSAFDGPLHGAAASHAYRILSDAITTGDPMSVYAERLRTEGRVEGFFPGNHMLYPRGDIRAATLLSILDGLRLPDDLRAAVDGLIDAARQRDPRHPSIEFALAVLVHACQMRPDSGEAIFAIARTAGWIAHALEEYREPGLRFRLEGTYIGPS
jgi:citrate synthase